MAAVDIETLTAGLKLGQRPHQTRAIRAALEAMLVRDQRGIVLADQVGFGKTYEALGTAALLWRHFPNTDNPVQRILIVVHRSVLMTKWEDEIKGSAGKSRRFPQYVQGNEWAGFQSMLQNVSRLGDKSDRSSKNEPDGVKSKRGKGSLPPNRVYIARNDLLLEEACENDPVAQRLAQTNWDIVIVDEAHNFTGLHTQRSKVFFPEQTEESRAKGLDGRFLLALTATPFQLVVKEMVNLLRIVDAPDNDLERVRDGLERYERTLDQFHARRRLDPADEGRRQKVQALYELRMHDASGGNHPGTPGLQDLLRRYLIRNVKSEKERDYSIIEKRSGGYVDRTFNKLDDLRSVVKDSPLLPLEGNDAWIYLHLRDLLVDAEQASREHENEKPSFIPGDLRQCLSSYEQLEKSAILAKQLPRARLTKQMVKQLQASGHQHPKVEALCTVVGRILDDQIERLRQRPQERFEKILVFNSLMRTASALKEALEKNVADRLEPFIEEQVHEAGLGSVKEAKGKIAEALDQEHKDAKAHLREKFERRFLMVDQEMLEGTGLEMKGEQGELVDIMYRRAKNHCQQPLFLLRMALWFRARAELTGELPDLQEVHNFVMQRVGDKLRRSIYRIVDDFLDDTPVQGDAFSEDNTKKARREIKRLAQVLASLDYVARFDGEQDEADKDLRRENFNRPYAPLVLLVSRVGEEGIDLQNHTRYILHYDAEWNPAKMEQREGRVDREGRKTRGAVRVQFFLLKDTYEERIFHTVMQRDAWFQVFIGSKRKELARGVDLDEESGERGDEIVEEQGRLTIEERDKVMIDLRP
jgi:superfamily II DNA or RNA helicase